MPFNRLSLSDVCLGSEFYRYYAKMCCLSTEWRAMKGFHTNERVDMYFFFYLNLEKFRQWIKLCHPSIPDKTSKITYICSQIHVKVNNLRLIHLHIYSGHSRGDNKEFTAIMLVKYLVHWHCYQMRIFSFQLIRY